ncbi:MAG: MFS transporter [Chloroflexi bacterium]|nr:MFS transporter [Chloroflexota bacterium]
MRYAKAKSWASSIWSAKYSRPVLYPRRSALALTAVRTVGYPEVETLPTEKRKGLRALWFDGLFTSMATGFVDPYYTLYMLNLHASNAQIGLVNALSQFSGAVTAIPGALLAERSGRYKQVWLVAGFLSRAMWLVMLVAPWVLRDSGAVWLVLAAWVAFTAITIFGTPAWAAVTADLVPAKVRGSYFASRNMIMHLAQLLAIPVAGLFVSKIGEPGGYQANLGFAFALGMISLYLFRQLPEHVSAPQAIHHNLRQTFHAAMRMPTFVHFLTAHSIFHLGVMIGGPFINVYMVQEAGFNVSTIGFSTTVGVFASLIGMRMLGRLHDRHGIIWTMRFGLGVPLIPVAYLWVNQPWQAYVISVLSAFTWAGYNLGAFNLLLASTPDEHRPHYIAIHTTVVSVVGAMGPILGGGLLDAVGYRPVFGLSFVGRALGLVLLFVLVHEPEAADDASVAGADLDEALTP